MSKHCLDTTAIKVDSFTSENKAGAKADGASIMSGKINNILNKKEMELVSGGGVDYIKVSWTAKL